MKNNKN